MDLGKSQTQFSNLVNVILYKSFNPFVSVSSATKQG